MVIKSYYLSLLTSHQWWQDMPRLQLLPLSCTAHTYPISLTSLGLNFLAAKPSSWPNEGKGEEVEAYAGGFRTVPTRTPASQKLKTSFSYHDSCTTRGPSKNSLTKVVLSTFVNSSSADNTSGLVHSFFQILTRSTKQQYHWEFHWPQVKVFYGHSVL